LSSPDWCFVSYPRKRFLGQKSHTFVRITSPRHCKTRRLPTRVRTKVLDFCLLGPDFVAPATGVLSPHRFAALDKSRSNSKSAGTKIDLVLSHPKSAEVDKTQLQYSIRIFCFICLKCYGISNCQRATQRCSRTIIEILTEKASTIFGRSGGCFTQWRRGRGAARFVGRNKSAQFRQCGASKRGLPELRGLVAGLRFEITTRTWPFRRAYDLYNFLPEGALVIAQRFNAGYPWACSLSVPVGTTEPRRRFSRPYRDFNKTG